MLKCGFLVSAGLESMELQGWKTRLSFLLNGGLVTGLLVPTRVPGNAHKRPDAGAE